MRKRRNLAEQTMGVRLRKEQVEELQHLMDSDPELDFSKAVRRGVDLFIAERTGRLRLQIPTRGGF
jgi:hypothetical protein